MGLFAVLRRKRQYERTQLPFMRSLVDFDIVVEIGYAQECGSPISLKQLTLIGLASTRTVRRRLDELVAHGVVIRRPKLGDQRAALLTLSTVSIRTLEKYGAMLFSLSSL
jgi:DNA-binding MarR family transcriptional regulator